MDAKRFLLFSFLCSYLPAQSLTSFDFLNIAPTTSRAAYGFTPASIPGSLEGLWGNPASIAGLSNTCTVLMAHHLHLGINLFSGGLAIGVGAFRFSAGTSLLLPGEVQGAVSLDSAIKALDSGTQLFIGNGAFRLGEMLSLPFHVDIGGSASLANEILGGGKIGAVFFDAGMILGFPFGKIFELNLGVDARHLGIQTLGGGVLPPFIISVGAGFNVRPVPWLFTGFLTQMDFLENSDRSYFFGLDLQLANVILFKSGLSILGNTVAFTAGAGVQFKIGAQATVRAEAAVVPGKQPDGDWVYQATVSFGRKSTPVRREIQPSPVKRTAKMPARIGMLVGEGFYETMRSTLHQTIRKKFHKYQFDEDGIILAKSEVNWLDLEKNKYADLAAQLKLSRLLVALRSQGDGGNRCVIFLFNAETGAFEHTEHFESAVDESTTAVMALAKIENWDIRF